MSWRLLIVVTSVGAMTSLFFSHTICQIKHKGERMLQIVMTRRTHPTKLRIGCLFV